MGVVLGGLADRPLGLAQRPLGCLRGACASGRPSAPTRNAYASSSSGNAAASQALQTTPPAAAEKPLQVLALAAARARAQLRDDPGREQQLEAERERVGGAGAWPPSASQQRQLVGEQREHLGMRVVGLEQPRDRIAGARGGVERRGALAQPRAASIVSTPVTV